MLREMNIFNIDRRWEEPREFCVRVGSMSDHSAWRDGLDERVRSGVEGKRFSGMYVRWEGLHGYRVEIVSMSDRDS